MSLWRQFVKVLVKFDLTEIQEHKAGYSLLDQRRNEDTLDELNVRPSDKKSAQYTQKWWNTLDT
jgi:hypothetical protein